ATVRPPSSFHFGWLRATVSLDIVRLLLTFALSLASAVLVLKIHNVGTIIPPLDERWHTHGPVPCVLLHSLSFSINFHLLISQRNFRFSLHTSVLITSAFAAALFL